MRTRLAWVNATVAFGLELVALAVLGWGGWRLGGSTGVRVLLAVGLPVAAAVLWGRFAAPRAPHPSVTGRLAVQALVFGSAAGLLGWGASLAWGAVLATVAVVNLAAAAALPAVAVPPADRPA